MLKAMTHGDILDDLKWGEHVWFAIPFEGGDAALDYQNDHEQGYGFLAYLQDEHTTLEVSEIPAHKEGLSVASFGDRWDWYDENARVHYHGVYTHGIEMGHHPAFLQKGTLLEKLDEWWEANEEEIYLPMRTTLWGHGSHHSRIGEYRSNTRGHLAILANTEAQFHAFYTD